jgi:hypothetical protein
MTFANAKKLHNEDEVAIKEKTVTVLCDDGNEYHHKEIK